MLVPVRLRLAPSPPTIVAAPLAGASIFSAPFAAMAKFAAFAPVMIGAVIVSAPCVVSPPAPSVMSPPVAFIARFAN